MHISTEICLISWCSKHKADPYLCQTLCASLKLTKKPTLTQMKEIQPCCSLKLIFWLRYGQSHHRAKMRVLQPAKHTLTQTLILAEPHQPCVTYMNNRGSMQTSGAFWANLCPRNGQSLTLANIKINTISDTQHKHRSRSLLNLIDPHQK